MTQIILFLNNFTNVSLSNVGCGREKISYKKHTGQHQCEFVLQMIVPDKSDYSKSEFFDYLIPLGKPPFSRKGSYFYNKCKKNYDSSFTKDTFHIHPTIIPISTAMKLSDIHMKRAISDKQKCLGS
jgi:hypothetical protein